MSSSTPTCSSDHLAFKDSRNDIVLRSSDGKTYPFRRLWLEAASSVFEDMFAVGRSGPSDEKETIDGLPVIDLPEKGELLERYLVRVHPQKDNVELRTVDDVEQLCEMAAKYQSRSVLINTLSQAACSEHGAPTILALGVIHQVPSAIKLALAKFDTGLSRTLHHGLCTWLYQIKSPTTLGHIPGRLFCKMSPQAVLRLVQYQTQQLQSTYDEWKPLIYQIELARPNPSYLDSPL